MELWPTAKYLEEGVANGGDKRTLEAAIRHARLVQSKGIPAVLSLRHLADHVNVSYRFLRDIVSRRVDAYRSFPIKKRPKGYRVICVPDPGLMRLQRWLHQHILRTLRPHSAAMAYCMKSSPLRCAMTHAGCKWLIKIDIRRFFESIDERRVFRVFRECGYQPLVAFELARLTTRVPAVEHRSTRARWHLRNANAYSIQHYRVNYIGHLPQGAPTSPMLANLVMQPFDMLGENIGNDYNLSYTRYSDDLTFSSRDAKFSRKMASEVIARVYGLLRSFELEPKSTKTNVVAPGARKIVLGLTVNDARPRLTREWRRMLECHVHYIVKLGYAIHAQKRGFTSILGCYRYVQGLLAYACQVAPEFGNSLRDQLSKVTSPF